MRDFDFLKRHRPVDNNDEMIVRLDRKYGVMHIHENINYRRIEKYLKMSDIVQHVINWKKNVFSLSQSCLVIF